MRQGLRSLAILRNYEANERSRRIFGRFAPAWPSDRVGCFNVTIASTFISALLVFAMWIPASSGAMRNGFAALYGFFSGALLSMVPTLAAQVCPDIEMIGAYVGVTFLVTSPGFLITLPIGGALVGDT